MGQRSPKQRIDKEVGWHGRNISPQAHRKIRNKKKCKAIADTTSDMVGLVSKKAHGHKEGSMGLAGRWRLLPKRYPIQEGMKGRKYKPKRPHILRTRKDKHQLVHIVESNNARAVEMVWRPERNKFRWSGACTKGQGTTYLYPANTWEVGHWSRYSEGMVWRWGENGVYSEILA